MNLDRKIRTQDARIGVIGLGYVGLPLALTATEAGFSVTGIDIDAQKVASLNSGQSYIAHIPPSDVQQAAESGRFAATRDFAELQEMDLILVCVPTPLTVQREPDMTYVTSTAEQIAEHIRPGHLVVFESTTYPGTTAELIRPILERGGLKSRRFLSGLFAGARGPRQCRLQHQAHTESRGRRWAGGTRFGRGFL